VKIPSLGVTQHIADEVNWILDLLVSLRLPLFDDDRCTDHITCSQYVELQVFMGFRGYQSRWGHQIPLQIFEGLMCLVTPLELVLFLEDLKNGSPLTLSHEMNLIKATIHLIKF
jgi:hypothetical protein